MSDLVWVWEEGVMHCFTDRIMQTIFSKLLRPRQTQALGRFRRDAYF